MKPMPIGDILDLIDALPDEWKSLGDGVEQSQISAAEAALDIEFPSEYAAFVSRYGLGGVGTCEICGVPSLAEKDTSTFLNVVDFNLEMRADGLSKDYLAFLTFGNGEVFAIDLTKSGSLRVIAFWPGDIAEDEFDPIAESFGEFLLDAVERLREELKGEDKD